MRWGVLHERWNRIHSFANAAIRLYGGVSLRELGCILDRYGERGDATDEQLEDALTIRATSPYTPYFPEDGFIYHKHFECLDDYIRFCGIRNRFTRWEPSDENEFLNYADNYFFEDTPAREVFVDYLITHFGDSRDTAEGVTDDVQRDLVDGESPDDVAKDFQHDFDNAAEADRKVGEIAALLWNVRAQMRIADYNGNAFASVQGTVPTARPAPKVGRNDPCPCGSRKKYKKCCGKHL